MSNLIRGPQAYLLNQLTAAELGMYVNSAGVKVLVFKTLGIEIPASTGTNVVIKSPSSGAKKKIKLAINWVWAGEREKIFNIEVTRQPGYSGFTNDQFPVSHTYSYKMNTFTTVVDGTLNDTDKDTIVDGLLAAIAADTQLTGNAVNTGAAVVAAQYATGGSDVPGSFTVESKTAGVDVTVRAYDGEFGITELVANQKPALQYDDVLRMFGIRAENEGKYPTGLPVSGTSYACVTLTKRTEGYDNVVASGQITREQVYHIYVPLSALSALELATVTNMSTNTNSMSDTGGDKAKSFYDYLYYLCGASGTYPITVTAGAVAGVTAPVKAATPVTAVTATDQYTGVVAWFKTSDGSAHTGAFAASTEYTAVITLTPKPGFTFINIVANGLTIAGSATDVNSRGSGVITATFAATGA